jgi:hypothetical protein
LAKKYNNTIQIEHTSRPSSDAPDIFQITIL